MEERLNKLFEAAASTKKVPGVAAIALDVSGKVVFKGAFGSTNLDDPNAPRMTTSTRAMLWSCTKLVTCVAALQLMEQGKLDLHDPVQKYVPEWKELQVLQGFSEDGTPKLRGPKTEATILMLSK
jgi:methyl acetate hydrolase